MNTAQFVVVLLSVLLLLGLNFFAPTVLKKQEQVNKTRALSAESVALPEIMHQAKENLPPEQLGVVQQLEVDLKQLNNSEEQTEVLKTISSFWNNNQQFALGGHYAEELAKGESTDSSWSIAATTYAICFQRSQEESLRDFCAKRSISAFENAVSLNPKNTTHKINLALMYVDGTPQPMKGIGMLTEIAEQEPDNILVFKTLGRLSLRTGQFEKAAARLENAVRINKKDTDAHFLLAEAYKGLGREKEALMHYEQCLSLTDKPSFKVQLKDIIKDLK